MGHTHTHRGMMASRAAILLSCVQEVNDDSHSSMKGGRGGAGLASETGESNPPKLVIRERASTASLRPAVNRLRGGTAGSVGQ